MPHPFADDDQAADNCDRRAGEAAVGDDDDTAEDKKQRPCNCGGGAPRKPIEHSKATLVTDQRADGRQMKLPKGASSMRWASVPE